MHVDPSTSSLPPRGTPEGQPARDKRSETTEGGNEDGQGSNQSLQQATPVTIAAPQRVADVADRPETAEGPGATQAPLADSPLAEGTIDGPSPPQPSRQQPPAHPPETQPGGPTTGHGDQEATEDPAPHGDTKPGKAHTASGCQPRTQDAEQVADTLTSIFNEPTANASQEQPAAGHPHDDESFDAFMASCQDGDPTGGSPPFPTPTPGRISPPLGPPGNADGPPEDPTSAARRAHFQRDYAALGPALRTAGT